MLILTIRYELRKGVFWGPLLLAYILSFTTFFFININIALIVPFLLQKDYYRPYRRNMVGIQLTRITDFNLSKLLLFTNISFLLWLLLGYALGRISALIISSPQAATQEIILLLEFLQVNLTAFTSGNIIANSDIITVKSRFLKTCAPAFTFNFFIVCNLAFVKIFSISLYYFPFLALTLAITVTFWYINIKTYRRLTHFGHHIS